MSALEQLDLVDRELAGRLSTALAQVETRLREVAADSLDPLIREASGYLIRAGGKRWRPLLVLLGARFGVPESPAVLDAAVAVELIHVASLHHDDVMDDAPLRHGVPSVQVRWGGSIAILVGDHLFGRGATVSLDLPEQARRAQAQAFERLVEGQIREVAGRRPGEDPVDYYLDVVRGKSAALMALAARLGGICSGADPGAVRALADYGEALGVAFQLSDDLIDILSTADRAGKQAGTDLRAGLVTLPVLYAMRGDDGGAERLRAILADGPVTDPRLLAEALDLLRASPAMAAAHKEVARHAGVARRAVERLSDLPARRALESICDLVVGRSA